MIRAYGAAAILRDDLVVGETSKPTAEIAPPAPSYQSSQPAGDGTLDPVEDGFMVYAREIGQWPLLTAQQEVDLAEQIAAGRQAKRRLAPEDLAPETRRRLEQTVVEGEAARHELVQHNLRLVVSVARRYVGQGLDFVDLIQEGNIGLFRAVDKFDPRLGFRFSTYAHWWIRQAITRAIAEQSRTIRLPVHVGERLGQARRVVAELTQELGRSPSVAELAEALGLTGDEADHLLSTLQRPLSLDQPIGEEGELRDIVADEATLLPEAAVEAATLRQGVAAALDTLTPREKTILRLRFGLGVPKGLTLDEIGHEVGLTRERVRQLEAQALRKLRTSERVAGLRVFLD